MFLKVGRHHRVPVGGRFVTLPTHVDLAIAIQFDSLRASAGSIRPAMWQETGGSLGKPVGSVELPKEPSMASVGPRVWVLPVALAHPPSGMPVLWERESDGLSSGIFLQ